MSCIIGLICCPRRNPSLLNGLNSAPNNHIICSICHFLNAKTSGCVSMDIPFERYAAPFENPDTRFRFADLIQRLGNPPNASKRDERENIVKVLPAQIFTAWIRSLPHPFVPGTSKKLFRLLFPNEGSRRRYDLRELRLAAALEHVLGVSGLARWDEVSVRDAGGTGCLGEEVRRAMCARKVSLLRRLCT